MIYDYDIDPVSIDLLPPDKRYPKIIAFIQPLLRPLQWLRDLVLGSYYQGVTFKGYNRSTGAYETITIPNYATGTYNYLDKVVYNKHIYSSNIDNNTDIPTTTNWTLIQDDFIGLKYRILYNGGKLTLEYALNSEFGGVFRQPPAVSDIYITNNTAVLIGFMVSTTEAGCGLISTDGSTPLIGNSNSYGYLNNFIVNILSSIPFIENLNTTYTATGGESTFTLSALIGSFSVTIIRKGQYISNFSVNSTTGEVTLIGTTLTAGEILYINYSINGTMDVTLDSVKKSVSNFIDKYLPSGLVYTLANY